MSYTHCSSRELPYLVSSCLHFISTAADSLDFVLIVSRWRIEWQYVFRSLTMADSVCKTHYNTPQRPFYRWHQIFLTWLQFPFHYTNFKQSSKSNENASSTWMTVVLVAWALLNMLRTELSLGLAPAAHFSFFSIVLSKAFCFSISSV